MSLSGRWPWFRRRRPTVVRAGTTASESAAHSDLPGPPPDQAATDQSATDQPPTDQAPTEQAPPASRYADFKVLLDDPAARPGLGFDGYATALADVILHSRAEFAVGIFGTWGSGKTTLMRAIERQLAKHDSAVPVWFAAWRYEKDPNLLLPLLDVMNESLEATAKGKEGWARQAAAGVGRAGLAFLAGLRVSANLPVFTADFEPSKVIEAIREGHDEPGPLSLYHAGLTMLHDAIRGLSDHGRRRVVVFVDDLDRCLPENALYVLESMKLFFDVDGCVFVVGLDQEIAERAVEFKFTMLAEPGATADASVDRSGSARPSPAGRSGANTADGERPPPAGSRGTEYLSKLFQLWFAVPAIKAQQLQDYLDAIEDNGELSDPQRQDFTGNVRPHFNVLQGEGFVNMRGIKRLINDYILQLKMLDQRLGALLNPNVVLALLCLNYRRGWKVFYDQLVADPQYTQAALRQAVEKRGWPESVWLANAQRSLPPDLVEYLRGLAAPVLRDESLPTYLSVAESTRSTDPWVLDARTAVSRLRGTGDELQNATLPTTEAAQAIRADVDRLYSLISPRRESFGRLAVLRQSLQEDAGNLVEITHQLAATEQPSDAFRTGWMEDAVPLLKKIDATLLEWHQYISA
jgi:hypothetical protein